MDVKKVFTVDVSNETCVVSTALWEFSLNTYLTPFEAFRFIVSWLCELYSE